MTISVEPPVVQSAIPVLPFTVFKEINAAFSTSLSSVEPDAWSSLCAVYASMTPGIDPSKHSTSLWRPTRRQLLSISRQAWAVDKVPGEESRTSSLGFKTLFTKSFIMVELFFSNLDIASIIDSACSWFRTIPSSSSRGVFLKTFVQHGRPLHISCSVL